MKQVLVLGCSGFSGCHFEKYVLSKNLNKKYKFIGIDNNLEGAVQSGAFYYQRADLSNVTVLKELLTKHKPYYIINFIGVFVNEVDSKNNLKLSLRDYFKINVGISEQILKTCSEKLINPRKILIIGSAAEYGVVNSNPVPNDSFASVA